MARVPIAAMPRKTINTNVKGFIAASWLCGRYQPKPSYVLYHFAIRFTSTARHGK